MMMTFNCTKCGACCMRVGKAVKQLRENPDLVTDPAQLMLMGFPYGFKEDGTTCEMYDPASGCKIYEDRPAVCRMDKMAPVYKFSYGLSEEAFYRLSGKVCNVLMKEEGIDDSFLIPEGQEIIENK